MIINDASARVELNNGYKMPRLGLGTYRITEPRVLDKIIPAAVDFGYRLIDTAAIYENEAGIGKALKNISIGREELFITTKLQSSDQGYDSALRAFDVSLKKLDLEYVDLYLVHWPITGKRLASWKAVEEIYKSGRAKAAGVSNFTIRHLEELLDNTGLVPAVNQVEFTPFLYQKELLEYCRERGIHVQAYSPLARTHKFSNPVIKELAEKYGKAPSQIMLRWALQHGMSVIPKSSNIERIKENSGIFDFEIDEAGMAHLNGLDEGYRVATNPTEFE